MAKNSFPSDGEIFIARKTQKQHASASVSSKKPLHWLKTVGATAAMLFLVVGINIAIVAGQQPVKQEQQTANPSDNTAGQTPAIYAHLSKDSLPAINQVALETNQDTIAHDNNNNPTNTRPINTTPINTTPLHINPNVNFDFGGPSNQISQLQSQIVQQMQSCIQLTQQAQSQVAQLRAQEQQLQIALEEINNGLSRINVNDPAGAAARAQLRQQREAAFFQRNQLLRDINTIRNQYSRARSECQNSVNRMQNAKRSLENQLNNSFRRSLNINNF